MNKTTLASKLFFRLAPTILGTIIIIGFLAYFSVRNQIEYMYDAQLISNTNILWVLLQDEFNEAQNEDKKRLDNDDIDVKSQTRINDNVDDYMNGRMFRVWDNDKIIMYSETAFPESVPLGKTGFSDIIYKKEKWRVYTQHIPKDKIYIQVGEKILLRNTLVKNIIYYLSLPLFMLLPLVGFLLWAGIKNGLRSVKKMGEQVQSRSPEDLSFMDTQELPHELRPLGQSINQLFSKISHSLDAERRFSDNAAHQLRTPLATLKLQLQMLEQTDSYESKGIINDLLASTERANYLVGKLLMASRVSHQDIQMHPVNLYHATANIIAETGMLINQKNIHLELSGTDHAIIKADETLLGLLITNLIENAVKFTPENGEINVSIVPWQDFWLLSIQDTGPGISEDKKDLVFQRFYRVEGNIAEGTGLGLSIVKDIIQRFSGKISLETPDNGIGLLAKVLFPKQ